MYKYETEICQNCQLYFYKSNSIIENYCNYCSPFIVERQSNKHADEMIECCKSGNYYIHHYWDKKLCKNNQHIFHEECKENYNFNTSKNKIDCD